MKFVRNYHSEKAHIEKIYQELILKHYRSPHHFGTLPVFNAFAELENINCGDLISLQIQKQDNIIQDIHFTGEGCSLSIASASIMCNLVHGKNINIVQEMTKTILKIFQGELPESLLEKYGETIVFQELISYKNRMACVSLPWQVLSSIIS